jgi:hypothetical protein
MVVKSKVLIIAIVVLVLGGGAGAYLLTRDDDGDSANQTEQNDGGSGSFDAVSNQNLPFVVNFSMSGENGESNATIEYDGKGAWRYSAEQEGQTIEYISANNYFYTRAGEEGWYKYPFAAGEATSFDTSSYEFSESDLAALKASGQNKGRENCPAGSCDVWETSDESGNRTTVYIDTDSRRISQIKSVTGGTTTTMVYDYRDVSIEIPADAQELPNFGQ